MNPGGPSVWRAPLFCFCHGPVQGARHRGSSCGTPEWHAPRHRAGVGPTGGARRPHPPLRARGDPPRSVKTRLAGDFSPHDPVMSSQRVLSPDSGVYRQHHRVAWYCVRALRMDPRPIEHNFVFEFPGATPTGRQLYTAIRQTFRVDTSSMVHLGCEEVTEDERHATGLAGPLHRIRPARPFDVRAFGQVRPTSMMRVKASCMVNRVVRSHTRCRTALTRGNHDRHAATGTRQGPTVPRHRGVHLDRATA